MGPKITLKDVAMRVGVTEMTVSSALRGVGRVGNGTRKKIVEVASQLGYRPNTAARSIRSGRFGCFALLVSENHKTALPPEMLKGIHREMSKHDLHLTLSLLPDEKLTDGSYMPKILRHEMSDGLLIKYDVLIPDGMEKLISRFRIPSIWINSKHISDCIYPDEIDASRQATEHLLKLGHERIGFLYYGGGKHYSTQDRLEGYRQAMVSAGLKPMIVPEKEEEKELPRDKRFESLLRWLQRDNRPTAVVAYSQTTAKMLLYTAGKLGIRVPEELSIISFGSELLDDLGLALTTMILPFAEIGEQAVEMLVKRVKNPAQSQSPRALKWRLAPGASCAPPLAQSSEPS